MKNRSSYFIIALLAVLSALSVYLYKNKSGNSTLDKEARNFKIEDTASITKIFMANKNGNQVLLEKSKNGWLVNGKYPARQDAISLLLYTMRMVDVKSPVAKAAKKNVIKQMSGKSILVQVYSGNDLIKQYYVGHENMDNDGTYMILSNVDTGENYEDPFLTYIPGFTGYLSVRYFLDEGEWRDRLVINYIPPQISTIKMENLLRPDSSFVIKVNSTTNFELRNGKGESMTFDEVKMKQYLAYFQNVNYEKLLTNVTKKLLDSLKQALPYASLSITNKKGETKVFNFVRKNSTASINDKYGVNYKYDPDRLYMRFDNDKEVALIQTFVFGKILQNYDYFLPKSPVKK